MIKLEKKSRAKRLLLGAVISIISFALLFSPVSQSLDIETPQDGFYESIELGDFGIDISAEEGVISEGAEVSVESISGTDLAKVEKAVGKVSNSDKRVLTETFDSKTY